MAKTKKVSHELISKTRMGAVWLKEFVFHKVRTTTDSNGEVIGEVPFKEVLHLISVGNQAIWLRPDQMLELKNLLDDSEE